MDNLEEPIHHEIKEEDGVDNPNTEEILFLNHYEFKEMIEERVLFVMITKDKHMHMVYDPALYF